MSRPGVSASNSAIARRYSLRSAWARGPRTAGPLLRLSKRNWMAARSIARPITPSSASISRTRWPLASPPIAGLHDISPIVSRRWVTSAVRAPSRAAAAAASQPAWPPPTTTTSYFARASLMRRNVRRPLRAVEVSRETSLPDAEIGKDHIEQILDVDCAGDAPEAAPGQPQIFRPQFGERRGEGADQRSMRLVQRRAMPRPGQERCGEVEIGGDAPGQRLDERRDAVTGECRHRKRTV